MIVWRGRLGHFLILLLFFNEYEIQMQSEKHSKVIERQPKKAHRYSPPYVAWFVTMRYILQCTMSI